MALALSFEDSKQIRTEGSVKLGTKGGAFRNVFFHDPDIPDFPDGHLTQRDPGRSSPAHFHLVDQFQIVIDGKLRIAGHEIKPYGVHFSRAYTPYGPVIADADAGSAFYVLRSRCDPSHAHRVPQEKERLMQVPNRQPWQITRSVNFPALPAGPATTATVLQAIPDIKDEQGLAVYTLSMKSNAQASAPDPSHGDGQYLVVLKGSLLHDDKELKAPALVFVYPKEGAFRIHAGSVGLEALVLNFPQLKPRAAHIQAPSPSAAAGFKKWQCTLCSFAYDEALGMPEEGIAAGTRWEDVPDSWSCPDCSASKGDFQMVEV